MDCDQVGRSYYGWRSKDAIAAVVRALSMPLLTLDLLKEYPPTSACEQTDAVIFGLIHYLRQHKQQDRANTSAVAKWQTWLRKDGAFEAHGVQLESRIRLDVSMVRTYFYLHLPWSACPLSGVFLAALVCFVMIHPPTLDIWTVLFVLSFSFLGAAVCVFGSTVIWDHFRECTQYLLQRAEEVEQEPRRLAVCTNGLIAATCPSAAVGDLICFITGCKTAVVLRQSNLPGDNQARYKLIGKARAELSNSDKCKYAAFAKRADGRGYMSELRYQDPDEAYGRLIREHQQEEWWRRFRLV